jgi:hypothetical protein
MPQQSRLSSGLSGIAGEYFVAAELSRRGYVASLTLRNTRGIDILASNVDATRSVGIQVKTKQGRGPEWVLTQKVETLDLAENLFFVFVCLNDLGAPEYYVVPRQHVVAYARDNHAAWVGTPGRGGRIRRDPMRKFRDPKKEFLGKWELLGLDSASTDSPGGAVGSAVRP